MEELHYSRLSSYKLFDVFGFSVEVVEPVWAHIFEVFFSRAWHPVSLTIATQHQDPLNYLGAEFVFLQELWESIPLRRMTSLQIEGHKH